MSPPRPTLDTTPPAVRALARMGLAIGMRIRDERRRRRWSMRELALRARLSVAAVSAVETGRPASLATYLALCDALGLTFDVDVVDRRRAAGLRREADAVHAAMGELEVTRLSALGFRTGVDEPFQHYQFAGRADVVAWSLDARTLLHLENRTRFPNLQEAAGAWNAKRAYLAPALAQRLEVRRGWASVTHVVVALWSAEVLHTLRLRTETLRALCPDASDGFLAWWSGHPPMQGTTSSIIVFDPTATGRQRSFCDLGDALRAKPRYRGYADAAEHLRGAGR